MLDLKRFQNNFIVSMQECTKKIYEWDTENGEGDYVSCYGIDYYDGHFDTNNFSDIGKKILEYINKHNCSDFNEDDLYIEHDCVYWNQVEDEDCNILKTIEEEERADECYLCHYRLDVLINGVKLTEDELKDILPKAS